MLACLPASGARGGVRHLALPDPRRGLRAAGGFPTVRGVAAVMILAAASQTSGVLHFLEITAVTAASSSVLISTFTVVWAVLACQLTKANQGRRVPRVFLNVLHALHVTPHQPPPE